VCTGVEGILLYKPTSLVLFAIFLRFNTGSGTGTLVSKVKISQGGWHQLVVTRSRRSANLSVDNEKHIRGESPQGTEGLNLDTDLFIGGVTKELKKE